ncbi:hypothetical protein [Candidatus Neptunochlamydia vexilliferae]|uniref:Uncharacterized protein n=1 Tax=Candidatus Neptunichlamydia vexilliferae TaxID=1651774 RepID=A0ABS0B1S9_9BACT|nr:hypothetical protein [Candidatus Neptunochlamydia vexilliferae]MBF5059827.1 hypothetical protein [Candidatus Neptunochlamydia vexilliferae]
MTVVLKIHRESNFIGSIRSLKVYDENNQRLAKLSDGGRVTIKVSRTARLRFSQGGELSDTEFNVAENLPYNMSASTPLINSKAPPVIQLRVRRGTFGPDVVNLTTGQNTDICCCNIL